MWQPLMSSGLTLSNFSGSKMGPRASRPGVASFAFLLPLHLPLSDISAGSLSSKGAEMLGQANLVPVLSPGGTERWKETGQETSCGRWKDCRERRREMGKRNCIYWLGARFCDLQFVMWSLRTKLCGVLLSDWRETAMKGSFLLCAIFHSAFCP